MKIFLDACVIIYWVELVGEYYKSLAKKFNRLREHHPDLTFAASELSVLECRVKPLREQNQEVLQHYQTFFTANDLELIPLDINVINQATQLRARYAIGTADALHAASALSLIDEVLFFTADKGFKKISGLEVVLI